jgi:hypothetical protein
MPNTVKFANSSSFPRHPHENNKSCYYPRNNRSSKCTSPTSFFSFLAALMDFFGSLIRERERGREKHACMQGKAANVCNLKSSTTTTACPRRTCVMFLVGGFGSVKRPSVIFGTVRVAIVVWRNKVGGYDTRYKHMMMTMLVVELLFLLADRASM